MVPPKDRIVIWRGPPILRVSLALSEAFGSHVGETIPTVVMKVARVVKVSTVHAGYHAPCGRAARESARNNRLEVPARAMSTSGQMLERAPESCHFLPLFCWPGEIPSYPALVNKSFRVSQIGLVSWCSQNDREALWHRARRKLPHLCRTMFTTSS